MMFTLLLLALILASVIVFIQIQLYLQHPHHREWCDEWFARFEEVNRKRFTDPELAWRYEVLEKAFHKSHGLG